MKARHLIITLVIAIWSFVGCSSQTNTNSTSTPAPTANQNRGAANRAQADKYPLATIAEGTYVVSAVYKPGSCVDAGAAENLNQNEGKLQRFNCDRGVNQKWVFKKDPERDKRYIIERAEGGNKFWDIENDSNENGAPIIWRQRENNDYQSWRLEDKGSGTFRIINDGAGRCLDYYSDFPDGRADLLLVTCGDVTQQYWKLEKR
jgi:hypothetical protein